MKNMKGILTNLIAVLVGILTFVFMSQPYFNVVIDSILGGASAEGVSGYAIIGDYFKSEETKDVILALSILIVAILAGLLILLGIFNMATSAGAVKVKNSKITNVSNVFISILMVLLNLVAVCIIASNKTGNQYISGSLEVAWALIVNFVLSFVALGATLIASLGKQKSSRKKK